MASAVLYSEENVPVATFGTPSLPSSLSAPDHPPDSAAVAVCWVVSSACRGVIVTARPDATASGTSTRYTSVRADYSMSASLTAWGARTEFAAADGRGPVCSGSWGHRAAR